MKKSYLIIVVAVMASLLEIIDTSIVNVALPTMMGNLGATLGDISMVITGYAIANAIVLPVSAWLGERIGRRKYYLGCIIAFTATSVACGLAPNLMTLTVFRIFQGLMGGALLPTSQALIYEQFPKEKAGMAAAIFGMSVLIGPTLGPVLGGYLTDNFGWRSIFNINLPLGMIAVFLGSICIFDREKHEGEHQHKLPLDTIGLILLVLGIGCLQFVLERGEADDWFSSHLIIVNSLVAATCIPAFVWWELKTKFPIINIRLFKNDIVVNGVLLMSALGFFLYGIVFLLPVFINRTFHYDATQIGALFIPGSLITMMLMPFVGKQLQRGVDPRILIVIGFGFIEACLYLMTRLSPLSSRSELLSTLYVRGIAMAFLYVPINASILSQFKGMELGQVSGLLNLFRQIGGSIGIAMIATLLSTKGFQNYLDLSAKVSLLNANTQLTYYSSINAFAAKFSGAMGMATAREATLKSIYYRIQNQVFMMTFNQLVFYIMIIVAVAIIPISRLKFKEKPRGPVDAH